MHLHLIIIFKMFLTFKYHLINIKIKVVFLVILFLFIIDYLWENQ